MTVHVRFECVACGRKFSEYPGEIHLIPRVRSRTPGMLTSIETIDCGRIVPLSNAEETKT